MNPSGTLLDPPTHAHLSSRLSTYTALNTETAPIVPMNSETGIEAPSLLAKPTRDQGFRRYGSEEVRRLRFIRQAQSAGFTLEQIKELLDLDASDDRARVREMATERVAALDATIVELKRARDALKRLAQECGSGSPGPCPILTSFDA